MRRADGPTWPACPRSPTWPPPSRAACATRRLGPRRRRAAPPHAGRGRRPPEAALAAIAELEGFDRGLYAGPVGWVDARGDGDWAVALRSATLDGTQARLVAGAGIVAGSDPDAEWDETEAKLAAMRSALTDG